MKIGKFNIFPKKIKVTVGLKCGKTFYFYCSEYTFAEFTGFSFEGAPQISGTLRPTIDIAVATGQVSWIAHEKTRLFHIY